MIALLACLVLAQIDPADHNESADPEPPKVKPAVRQEDPKKVLEAMTERLRENPADVEAWQTRAEARLALGQVKEAVADADECLRLNPAQGKTYRIRARARGALGDLKGGLSDLAKAIELEPGVALNWLQRARFRKLMGDEEGAKADAERAKALDGTLDIEAALKGKDPEAWPVKPKTLKERIDDALKAKDAAKLAEVGEEGVAELKKLAEHKEHGELAKQALAAIEEMVKKVEGLAKELDADDLVERDKATAAIVKLGRGVVPTLKRLAATASKGAKAQLLDAIQRIEK